jgi:hypothetical protein
VPILEEEGPYGILFQQDEAPAHFQDVMGFLYSKFPEN